LATSTDVIIYAKSQLSTTIGTQTYTVNKGTYCYGRYYHTSVNGDYIYLFINNAITPVSGTIAAQHKYGQITYMKDEYGNEANYDFKNMLNRNERFPHRPYEIWNATLRLYYSGKSAHYNYNTKTINSSVYDEWIVDGNTYKYTESTQGLAAIPTTTSHNVSIYNYVGGQMQFDNNNAYVDECCYKKATQHQTYTFNDSRSTTDVDYSLSGNVTNNIIDTSSANGVTFYNYAKKNHVGSRNTNVVLCGMENSHIGNENNYIITAPSNSMTSASAQNKRIVIGHNNTSIYMPCIMENVTIGNYDQNIRLFHRMKTVNIGNNGIDITLTYASNMYENQMMDSIVMKNRVKNCNIDGQNDVQVY